MSDQSTLDVGVEPEYSPEEQEKQRNEEGEAPSNLPDVSGDDPSYTGGETRECTYTHHLSVCENHPCPGRAEPGQYTHHQFTFAGTNLQDDLVDRLKEQMSPEECSCGGSIEGETVRGEWPHEDLSKESILEMFRETNGQIVIEFYPRSYDARFYIGEIGGRYCVETEHYEKPDLPTGVDDLVELVREHPNRLVSVEDTSREGIFEDYQNGED